MQTDFSKYRHIEIILPFKLPTWNALLAMNRWERAKVNKWIKESVVYIVTHGERDSLTPMELLIRPPSMGLSLLEYSSMTTPRSLIKSRLRKRLAKLRVR